MPRIMCLSDTHGLLPNLDITGIDIVLYAGDFSRRAKLDYTNQLVDFEQFFCPWIKEISDFCEVYFTLGNHETFWEAFNLQKDYNDITKKHLLLDSGLILEKRNLIIWGIPHTNKFGGWGFNVDDSPEGMGRFCGHIPTGTNIILSHGPVYGVNDYVDYPHDHHAGSKELARRVNEIKPKLFISGHLHDDRNYGVIEKDSIKYIGCSLMNEQYEFCRKPIIVEI